MPEVHKVVPGSMGSLLDPPGHPNHYYHVATYRAANSRKELGAASLSYARENPEQYPGVQGRIERLFAEAKLVCSESWLRSVYGYFRSMYAPEDDDKNVSKAIQNPDNSLPPERHLGYLCVKADFPEHTPRLDLIRLPAGAGWGVWPCVKCGAQVQYSAEIDGFEAYGKGSECGKGGVHEISTDA